MLLTWLQVNPLLVLILLKMMHQLNRNLRLELLLGKQLRDLNLERIRTGWSYLCFFPCYRWLCSFLLCNYRICLYLSWWWYSCLSRLCPCFLLCYRRTKSGFATATGWVFIENSMERHLPWKAVSRSRIGEKGYIGQDLASVALVSTYLEVLFRSYGFE